MTNDQKANLSEEFIAKAMQCETPEQLIELAKSEGIELTLDDAQAYLAEMDDIELDSQQLKQVAGGTCWDNYYKLNCNGAGYEWNPCEPDTF